MEKQKLDLDPEIVAKHAKDIACNCGNKTFDRGFCLNELSEIVSPTGLPILIPIDVIYCTKCGAILEKKKQ